MWETLLLQVGMQLLVRWLADDGEDTTELEGRIASAKDDDDVKAIAVEVATAEIMDRLNAAGKDGQAAVSMMALADSPEKIKAVAKSALKDDAQKPVILGAITSSVEGLIKSLVSLGDRRGAEQAAAVERGSHCCSCVECVELREQAAANKAVPDPGKDIEEPETDDPEWITCEDCGNQYPASHVHICSD